MWVSSRPACIKISNQLSGFKQGSSGCCGVDLCFFYSFYIFCHRLVAFGIGIYGEDLQLGDFTTPSTTQNHFSNMTLVIFLIVWTILLLNCDGQLQGMLGLSTQISSNKILSQPLIAFLCLLDYRLIFPTQNCLNDTLNLQCRSNSREDHLHSLSTMQIAALCFCIRGHWGRAVRPLVEICRRMHTWSFTFCRRCCSRDATRSVIERGQEGVNTIPSTHSLPYSKGQSHS